MCDPATLTASTIIPAALAAGGTALNTFHSWQTAKGQEEANAQANAMSLAARDQERLRQSQFSQEQHGAWDQARERLTPENFQADNGANIQNALSRLDGMGAGQEASLLPGQARSSEAVRTVIAKQTSQAAQQARQHVQAAAALTGYGDTSQQRGAALGDSSDLLSVLSGLRSGSLGVSQTEAAVPAARVTPNPWVTGAAGLAQAAGNVGLQNAGYNAGFGG